MGRGRPLKHDSDFTSAQGLVASDLAAIAGEGARRPQSNAARISRQPSAADAPSDATLMVFGGSRVL